MSASVTDRGLKPAVHCLMAPAASICTSDSAWLLSLGQPSNCDKVVARPASLSQLVICTASCSAAGIACEPGVDAFFINVS